MNCVVYLLYILCIGIIRIYKYLEYGILFIFEPCLKWKAKKIAKSIGIILHCPEDLKGPLCEIDLSTDIESKDLPDHKYNSLLHLKVNSNRFFPRVANLGWLACGEAYLDKTWDIYNDNLEDITEFVTRTLENNLNDLYYNPWNKFLEWVELHAFNLQTRERAFQVGKFHYDLGNDLFETMLDPWMQYTCGYWKDTGDLKTAQINKMELLAKKLDLDKPKLRILDIGCGWGTLCKYLAEKYGAECVGVTIGENGASYGRKICEGLPVDIRLQDYREINEKFDRIVSVGMFEHVGFRNYREFFKTCGKCLKDDGILVLHTIGRNHSNAPRSEPWGNKYVFPNGNLPNIKDIAKTTKGLFVVEDWHNFGFDYVKTLHSWRENFVKGWPKIEDKYGDDFYRLWTLYLSAAKGLFRSRRAQVWQIVMSKDGIKREYRAAR